MAYYEESPCLDVTKDLYAMQYVELKQEEVTEVIADEGSGKKAHKVDFSTNAYLFFREKDILRKDVSNLCEYTRIRHTTDKSVWGPEIEEFPFEMVQTRVCQILEKYHEQPALLGEISHFIINEVMQVGKLLLHRFVAQKTSEIKDEQLSLIHISEPTRPY